ncbi:hypothetical protein [Virgibacillus sp. L01]|uniref:hypothetical protein n=1 Tax=Virgibacillus sp. L01 TaxID=3457429 RepID=UPI003FD453BF
MIGNYRKEQEPIDAKWQANRTQSRSLVTFFTEDYYHDVALTKITQKYGIKDDLYRLGGR